MSGKNKKRVLLINPPQSRETYVQAPLGLLYLASVLEQRGHEVMVLDSPGTDKLNNIDNVILTTQNFKPDAVGITSMTPFIESAYSCIKEIRKIFSGKIIMGGPHVSALKGKVLEECKELDVVVIGEGENVICGIIEGKLKEKLIVGEPVSKLDDLPFPAWHLVEKNKYNDVFGTQVVMISSRGCIYNCLFCKSDKNYRGRSPKNVVDEIEMHVKNKKTKIAFYDDNMALKRDRLVEICDEIIKRGLKIQFKMETRVNQVDLELLKLLKRAGCYVIAYGIESARQHVLNFLRKGITPEMAKNAVKETHRAKIQTIGYFIIGSPVETKDDIIATINFAIELDLDYAQFALLTPLPGTDLWEYVVENELLLGGTITYFGKNAKSLIKHPVLSQEELKSLSKLANKKFYMRLGYIIKTLRRIKSLNDLKATIRGFNVMIGGGGEMNG